MVQSQTLLQASPNPRAMSENKYCISNLIENTEFYSDVPPVIGFLNAVKLHAVCPFTSVHSMKMIDDQKVRRETKV